MTTLTKRSTIYLDPAIHQALRLRSNETSQSVSEIINLVLREAFAEDVEDLEVFKKRGMSHWSVLKK